MPAKKVDGCRRKDGYILVTEGGKRRYLHRYIMEQSIGRKLATDETVHHINGVRDDNRLENLEILSRSEHTIQHPKLRNPNRYSNCESCGVRFYKVRERSKVCSKRCQYNLMSNKYELLRAKRQEVGKHKSR